MHIVEEARRVIEHAKKRSKRRKNPSMQFYGIRNPKKALDAAMSVMADKVFNQQKHPEIRSGEVWITNADWGETVGWRTKRYGMKSLDRFGIPIGSRWPGSFPVFAQKSELQKAGINKK